MKKILWAFLLFPSLAFAEIDYSVGDVQLLETEEGIIQCQYYVNFVDTETGEAGSVKHRIDYAPPYPASLSSSQLSKDIQKSIDDQKLTLAQYARDYFERKRIKDSLKVKKVDTKKLKVKVD